MPEVNESIERKVIVPLWQYEEGVKAINQIAIIKRMVSRGCISMGNLMDVLDIPEWDRERKEEDVLQD